MLYRRYSQTVIWCSTWLRLIEWIGSLLCVWCKILRTFTANNILKTVEPALWIFEILLRLIIGFGIKLCWLCLIHIGYLVRTLHVLLRRMFCFEWKYLLDLVRLSRTSSFVLTQIHILVLITRLITVLRMVRRYVEVSLKKERRAMSCTCSSVLLLSDFKKWSLIQVLIQRISYVVFLIWALILARWVMITTSHRLIEESNEKRIFTLLLTDFFSVILLFCDLSTQGRYFCRLLFESWIIWNELRIALVFFYDPNFLGCILNPSLVQYILTTLYVFLRLIKIILILEWLELLVGPTFVGLSSSMAVFERSINTRLLSC